MGETNIPEREIEDLARTTGHQSFMAFARWLRTNREETLREIRARSDSQDLVLAGLTREVAEVKRDGKATRLQAENTNGRVTELEIAKKIEEELRKERARVLQEEGARRDRRSEWERLGAGAFLGAFGIGLVTLILHLVGAA